MKTSRNADDTVGGRVPVRPEDVVGGRGRFIIRRPGNECFERLIDQYAIGHTSMGGNLDTTTIQIEVMAQLLPGGRMMTYYDKDTDTAVELTPKGARTKIGQAIRYRKSRKKRDIEISGGMVGLAMRNEVTEQKLLARRFLGHGTAQHNNHTFVRGLEPNLLAGDRFSRIRNTNHTLSVSSSYMRNVGPSLDHRQVEGIILETGYGFSSVRAEGRRMDANDSKLDRYLRHGITPGKDLFPDITPPQMRNGECTDEQHTTVNDVRKPIFADDVAKQTESAAIPGHGTHFNQRAQSQRPFGIDSVNSERLLNEPFRRQTGHDPPLRKEPVFFAEESMNQIDTQHEMETKATHRATSNWRPVPSTSNNNNVHQFPCASMPDVDFHPQRLSLQPSSSRDIWAQESIGVNDSWDNEAIEHAPPAAKKHGGQDRKETSKRLARDLLLLK